MSRDKKNQVKDFKSQDKLSKREYVIKAAKLFGLEDVEIKAIEDDLDGVTIPNLFMRKRCEPIKKLYESYMRGDINNDIDLGKGGKIDLDNYQYQISKRRLNKSIIGDCWFITPQLNSFLAIRTPDYMSHVREKYYDLARYNHFVIPQMAKEMGVDAVNYSEVAYTDEVYQERCTRYVTKDFLNEGEQFIPGEYFVRDHSNIRRINIKELLNSTNKYLKEYYKTNGFSKEEYLKDFDRIRKGLIKQTVFNKFAANNSELDSSWGLIQGTDMKLRLAPLFDYDTYAGAELKVKSPHRCTSKSRDELLSFIQDFSKEAWFREWITSKVANFDINKVFEKVEKDYGINLSDNQKEYYEFLSNISGEQVKQAVEINFNSEKLAEVNKEKVRDRVVRSSTRFVDKLNTVKNFVSSKRRDDER